MPVEPTPEMIAAMAVVNATAREVIDGRTVHCIGMAGAVEAFESMLDAAPCAPTSAGADGRYPEGFNQSCGIPARFMRAANAALCDMIGKREWDVPCLAMHMAALASPAGTAQPTSAAPAGVTERIAIMLWERFSPDHRMEWETEPHKGEYRHTAQAVLTEIAQPTSAAAGVQPVAWQWRRKGEPWSLEKTFNSEVFATTPDSEVRRLYATPPTPASEAVVQDGALKDHEIRELVNNLTGIAKAYYGTDQLRERISTVVLAALRSLPQQPTGERNG